MSTTMLSKAALRTAMLITSATGTATCSTSTRGPLFSLRQLAPMLPLRGMQVAYHFACAGSTPLCLPYPEVAPHAHSWRLGGHRYRYHYMRTETPPVTRARPAAPLWTRPHAAPSSVFTMLVPPVYMIITLVESSLASHARHPNLLVSRQDFGRG